MCPQGDPTLVHEAGSGGAEVLPSAAALLAEASGPAQTIGADSRPILVAVCHTRFGSHAGIAVWRAPYSRAWDNEDRLLVVASASIIRMVLEHEAIQQEMGRQARTDPLTGILNRRAFLDELSRHIDRLDREEQPGTLLFADLDSFKPVNDRLGHDVGDQVLVQTAAMLRKAVRPSDLVARLGGDEFALWMNGADHMTAAERAEWLTVEVPKELRPIAGGDGPTPTMSIGIATRLAKSGEPIDNLLRRADRAMYEVKRTGRGRWLVSQGDEA
jgi:diguanylate cyclase (GGDEF)-like protein